LAVAGGLGTGLGGGRWVGVCLGRRLTGGAGVGGLGEAVGLGIAREQRVAEQQHARGHDHRGCEQDRPPRQRARGRADRREVLVVVAVVVGLVVVEEALIEAGSGRARRRQIVEVLVVVVLEIVEGGRCRRGRHRLASLAAAAGEQGLVVVGSVAAM